MDDIAHSVLIRFVRFSPALLQRLDPSMGSLLLLLTHHFIESVLFVLKPYLKSIISYLGKL